MGGRAWFRLYLAAQTDNGLLKLLHQCMNDESQIFVSLVNRKVYVGWVADAPRTPHDSYFMLALTLSGHRDERTLEFRETENYTKRMPAAPTGKDAFLMLIDLRHVATAYPFDRDRYEREFALKTKATSIYVP
ncbi:MAG TPA: hypothetical protein VES20_22675 [Bryobacteraceae bacterium]|nr:hypothetical protein [Bryobacteraceae bacterium]